MFARIAATLGVLALLAGAGQAQEVMAGSIAISQPWSRPTPPKAPVASGYMKLTNTGAEADSLLSISSPVAKRAEIHRSVVENGIASMRPAGAIVIEPGKTVDFEQEKLHIMFMEPTQMLKDGEKFSATLVFDKAGPVDVEFSVQRKPPSASGNTSGGMAH